MDFLTILGNAIFFIFVYVCYLGVKETPERAATQEEITEYNASVPDGAKAYYHKINSK